jgi:hypothetical protein
MEQVKAKYKLGERDEATGFYRIIALRDIPRHGVRAGDVGGFVAREENLSQDGDAWIEGDARVFDDALVCGEALISGSARIYCTSRVYGNARVYDKARVHGNAEVYGHAEVCDSAEVGDNALVYGCVNVYNDTRVFGDARIYDGDGGGALSLRDPGEADELNAAFGALREEMKAFMTRVLAVK